MLQFIYLTANYIYYSFFGIYLSPKVIFYLFQEGTITVTKGIFPFGGFVIIFLIDLPLLILILRKNYFKNFKKIKLKVRILTFLLSFLIFLIYIEFRKEKVDYFKRRAELHEDFTIVEKYGLLYWQLTSIFYEDYYLEKLKKSENLIEVKDKRENFANFIFIQLEAMDSYVVKLSYKGNKIMPYLSKISKENVYYPYTISYHFGGGTSDCEFSVINSLEPLKYYPSMKLFNYSYDNSFVKELKRNGFIAKAFHGNYAAFFNRRYAFRQMGFDKFFDIKDMNLNMKGWGASDEEVFEFVLKELKEEKKPFFYHIITMSSHFPYTNVLNYHKNDALDHPERVVKNYFLSMNYVDNVLKKFIPEFIKKENTYIFIFGDHAPEIYFLVQNTSSAKLYIEMEKFEFVPLIIITPDKINYIEEKLCASFLDIAPTLLFSSGISFKYYTEGENLLSFPISDKPITPYEKTFTRLEVYKKIQRQYEYLIKTKPFLN